MTEFKLIAAFLVLLAGFAGGAFASRLVQGKSSHNTAALANTFAGGTFLYIAVMDILPEEFAGTTRRLPRYAMTLIGFIIMAIVAIWS